MFVIYKGYRVPLEYASMMARIEKHQNKTIDSIDTMVLEPEFEPEETDGGECYPIIVGTTDEFDHYEEDLPF